MQVEEIIVADSSPLIGLARIRRLELLRSLARRVAVPPAVWREIVAGRRDAPGAREVAAAKWIEILTPGSKRVAGLLTMVDRGEAEAIALAMNFPLAVLLIDDLRARRVAAARHLRIIGTVGLLTRARKLGLVLSLGVLLRKLVAQGIHLDERLIAAALAEVGET